MIFSLLIDHSWLAFQIKMSLITNLALLNLLTSDINLITLIKSKDQRRRFKKGIIRKVGKRWKVLVAEAQKKYIHN